MIGTCARLPTRLQSRWRATLIVTIKILLTLESLLVSASAQNQSDSPVANPARPTVSTPATLPPAGYLQFETGFLAAWHGPEVSSQSSLNEVVKMALVRRLQVSAGFEPIAHSRADGLRSNDAGDINLGVQGILHSGEGKKPTISLAYLRRVYGGSAPDLDINSSRTSALLLVSADVKGFHYDNNYVLNEVIEGEIHRAAFGQTISLSHPLKGRLGLTGEIWHFTQPFLRGHAIANLWALNYNARNNLVFDAGFDRGLTSTSARWEVFTGFTYLLPRRVHRL
jgi:hypothetical protein